MSTQTIIKPYISLIKGVVALFSPFLEVAIHDITTGKIMALYNNLSNRKVGDSSPIEQLKIPVEKFPDVFDPYYETNWNGHKIKCTSITIRDENKRPILLICFNFDTSVFQDVQLNLETFLAVSGSADNPVELFNENWQGKIDKFMADYIIENKLLIANLSREQKQVLIQELSKHGVFFYKNAPNYIARKLAVSRATIYNHLKILRAVNTSS